MEDLQWEEKLYVYQTLGSAQRKKKNFREAVSEGKIKIYIFLILNSSKR